jgi:hypothetical protein
MRNVLTQNQSEWVQVATLATKSSPPISSSLVLLKNAVDNARMQFRRIENDAQALYAALKGGALQTRPSTTPLFGDIHFLLISLDKIDMLLKLMIRYLPTNQSLKTIQSQHQKALKDYNDFRNQLEHIDNYVKQGTQDLGNLNNGIYTFDGKSFDLGTNTESEVEAIFSEILKALT